MRTLSASSSARLELLSSVATYWRRNSQFHLIVIDKLLQYRLVDSADVVAWVFGAEPRKEWCDLNAWAALNSVVRTIEGRVAGAKGRLDGIRNEEEAKAAEKAEPVDPGESSFSFLRRRSLIREADAIIPDNEDISTALSQLTSVERELELTIIEVVRQFALLLRTGGDKADWELWWTEGWFREFCRSLAASRLLALPAVVEGIEKLALEEGSTVVAILDSAKAWNDFA